MLKRIAISFAMVFIASCGGGGSVPYPPGSTTNSVADLILTLSSAQLPNTGTASVVVTVTAVDASRNTLASAPVSIGVNGGAILSSVSGSTTSPAGIVTANLGTGGNPSNRLLTVTATSGNVTKSTTVQVVGTKITATLVQAVVVPGASAQVQYVVTDQAGNPMVGQVVQVVAPGLTPADVSGLTGANGEYTYAYTAPTTVGSYTVTTTAGGKTDVQTVVVQPNGSTVVPVVTAQITAASVSANPSVVSVNLAAATTNRSEIRALFLGANNQPIQNVRARFDLNGDPNSIGGSFTTGGGTLYTDVNGVVTTAYVPGTRSSPTDGVNVRVCYGVSDTDPNLLTCATSKLVTLTVVAEPLGVSIGTDEKIITDRNNGLVYVKKFIISVADAAGVAKADVNLVASVDLPNYRKGFYNFVGGKWVKVGPLPSKDFAVCLNEDLNRNGVLEAGEDTNGDGQLWPRKPDVTVRLLSSKTAADGTAELEIQYAKDHGSWVDALITVSASGVAGSEGRASYFVSPVPVDADSINAVSSPAFQVSPYGVSNSCSSPN